MTISKIKKLHDMLVNREISCVQLTQKYIDEIKNDYVHVLIDKTMIVRVAFAKNNT